MARPPYQTTWRQNPPYQGHDMESIVPPPEADSHPSPLSAHPLPLNLDPSSLPANDGVSVADTVDPTPNPDSDQPWDDFTTLENYEWSPTPEQMAQFDLEFEIMIASRTSETNPQTDTPPIPATAPQNFFSSSVTEASSGLSQPTFAPEPSFGSDPLPVQDKGDGEQNRVAEQYLEGDEADEESDEGTSEDEDSDEDVDQHIWDPSIVNLSQAQVFLLTQTPGRKVVSIPGDDISVHRQNLTQFAQTLFDAIPIPPPKAKLEWGDRGSYYDGYQQNGLIAVKKLLRTKNGCRIAQSQAIVAVAKAADLHGPGLVSTAKGLTMDLKLKFSDRIQSMIDCLQIKHIARKLIEGDEAFMAKLVLNPKGLLKTRETAAKNNAGKHKTFKIGKDALASQVGSTDCSTVAKSNPPRRKKPSSLQSPHASQQSMGPPSKSASWSMSSAAGPGASNSATKRLRGHDQENEAFSNSRKRGRLSNTQPQQIPQHSTASSHSLTNQTFDPHRASSNLRNHDQQSYDQTGPAAPRSSNFRPSYQPTFDSSNLPPTAYTTRHQMASIKSHHHQVFDPMVKYPMGQGSSSSRNEYLTPQQNMPASAPTSNWGSDQSRPVGPTPSPFDLYAAAAPGYQDKGGADEYDDTNNIQDGDGASQSWTGGYK